MIIVKCKYCKQEFSARIADRKCGWARFCSKSCKAKSRKLETGSIKHICKAEV